MMGFGKGNSLQKWQFLVSMLDFWGLHYEKRWGSNLGWWMFHWVLDLDSLFYQRSWSSRSFWRAVIFFRYKDPSVSLNAFLPAPLVLSLELHCSEKRFGVCDFRGNCQDTEPRRSWKKQLATIMFPLIWNWSFSNLAWQRNKSHVRQSAESTLTCLEGKVDELLKSMANLQQEMTMIKGFLANSRSTPPMIASATASKNQHSSCQKASFVFNRTLLSLLLTWEWRRCCYILGEV